MWLVYLPLILTGAASLIAALVYAAADLTDEVLGTGPGTGVPPEPPAPYGRPASKAEKKLLYRYWGIE